MNLNHGISFLAHHVILCIIYCVYVITYYLFPDAALFLQGSSPHYIFLETIVEETSDDLRSESDRSGSRSSPVGWLATDSESGSVIHVDLEGLGMYSILTVLLSTFESYTFDSLCIKYTYVNIF